MTAATIAPELGRHWVKRLARQCGVPIETAWCWVYRGMPASRHRDIRRAVLAECDRLETMIAETRRRWGIGDEAAGAVAGREAGEARSSARAVERR